jgi:hypothetical protein
MARSSRIVSTLSILVALCCIVASGATAFAQFVTSATATTSTGSSPYGPHSVVAGDFNRDGNLDLAAVSYLPVANVSIFLGNGDGTFRVGASYAVAAQPFYAATASLRNNGILDLVVGDSLSDDVYVMLGKGDGTFQPPVAYPTIGEPVHVSTGDFTGDGKLDIIALTGDGCSCVEVLPGNGNGTFGASIATTVPYNIGGYAMATGHFNGDNELDVAVSGSFGTASQVDILLGNGDGSFRPDGYYPVSLAPYSIAAGRFNGEKVIDLAVGDLEASYTSVLLGKGNGTFEQAVDYGTWSPTWVAAGDLNGDGREDLAVSNSGSPTNQLTSSVSVLLGNGDGTFQPGAVYPAGIFLEYVVIGDFNGDHMPDLVAVDQSGGSLITLLNTGTVTFSPTTPITFPTQRIGTTGAPQSVTLTNNGATPLSISSISDSGEPFNTQTDCKASIAPGGACSISASFKPQNPGTVTGAVTIRDSASIKAQIVELVGTGTEVKLAPAQLNFPPRKVGTQSASKVVLLTNLGNTSMSITSISVGGGFNSFREANDCPASLAAGASCSIQVRFVPKRTGPLSGSVGIVDTGGGLEQFVPLTGTGD